jgi:hypothetical protein
MMGSAASRKKDSEPLGLCAAWDPKSSLRWRNDKKPTSSAMNRKRNELRIMLREKLLGQESKLKTQWQRFTNRRTI